MGAEGTTFTPEVSQNTIIEMMLQKDHISHLMDNLPEAWSKQQQPGS